MKPSTNPLTAEGMHTVESLPVGEYVKRTPDAKKVYIRGDYIYGGEYSLVDANDSNREIIVKRGTKLFAGFTY